MLTKEIKIRKENILILHNKTLYIKKNFGYRKTFKIVVKLNIVPFHQFYTMILIEGLLMGYRIDRV